MAIHPREQRIILKHADDPDYGTGIDAYMDRGGYDGLRKAVDMGPEAVVEAVKKSQLRGRGGAGFPCGVKWSFINHKSGKPVYLICNADESEPGTFKDRQIIHKDPHQLIEGMMISNFANKVAKSFIYIREEMPHGARLLEQAIREATEKGFSGENVLDTGYSCGIVVHRGAAAYICGEETGLIESLEGKRAYPRIKPPYFPAALGLYMSPTIVNNVETLCHVKHIVEMGAEEFAKIGRPNNTGTRIWCVSGGVQRPGYYEVAGLTVGELVYDVCGGPKEGRSIKAIIPGGSSMKILKNGERYTGKDRDGNGYDWGLEDVPLDYDGIVAAGSMSGSSGMMVLDDTVEIPVALANLLAFYSHESCGQCTPCREGSFWLKKITSRMVHGDARPEDVDLLKSVADQIEGRTICAFGFAVAWPVQSYLQKFEDEFRSFAERHRNQEVDRTTVKELALNHG